MQAITPPVESAGTRTQISVRAFLRRSESPPLSMALPMWRGFHGLLRVRCEAGERDSKQRSMEFRMDASVIAETSPCKRFHRKPSRALSYFWFARHWKS